MAADRDTSSGAIAAQATAAPPGTTGNSQPEQPQQRLIIKDGRMIMTVTDTAAAVEQATQLAVDLGGYIISQALRDDSAGFRYASMRLAVPVNQFEFAMRQLRGLGDVTDESSSGEDVTDEFVDLNSRVTNLEATRDRLLDFLDQAQTIDEVLEVNQELNSVEEEIAVIQGRINFLRDRAAFSTIDLTLNPLLPTPTPSPTPTATPIPTPESWRPADTAGTALVELQNTTQDVADFSIFYGIVCGPWLLLLAGALFLTSLVTRGLRRRRRARMARLPISPVVSTPRTESAEAVAEADHDEA
jgi:hypothetical protein